MSDANFGIVVAGAIAQYGGAARSKRSIGPITATVTEVERHHDEMEITDHPVQQGATISDHVYRRPAELILEVGWSNSPQGSTGGILGDIKQAVTQKLSGTFQNQLSGAAANAIGGSALGNLAVAKLADMLGSSNGFINAQVNTGKGKSTSSVNDVYQSLLKLQIEAVPFDVYTGKRRYVNMLIKAITVQTDKNTENSLIATLNLRQVIIVQTEVVAVNAPPDAQSDAAKTNPTADLGQRQVTLVDPTGNPAAGAAVAAALRLDGRIDVTDL